jgi:large subunit ribosomal protein L3
VAIELLCRKIGMTRLYTDEGESVPVTVLEAGPNTVVQTKTLEKDGYTALQLGYGERRRKTISKPELGHFEKAGVSPKRYLRAVTTRPSRNTGLALSRGIFPAAEVDVIGTSKGGTAAW